MIYKGTPGSGGSIASYSSIFKFTSGDVLYIKTNGTVTVGGDTTGLSDQFALRWS